MPVTNSQLQIICEGAVRLSIGVCKILLDGYSCQLRDRKTFKFIADHIDIGLDGLLNDVTLCSE